MNGGAALNSISVIMINKDRAFCLHRSISCVVKQLTPCDELILIDDNSGDDSLEVMRSFSGSDNVAIERCSSGGNRSLVRNRAAAHAHGDVLLFLDSDVALLPDGIEHIRRAFDDAEVSGASGTVFGNDHDRAQFEVLSHMTIEEMAQRFDADPSVLYKYPQFFDYRRHNPAATEDVSRNWRCYFGCFNAARTEVYRELGGFDEGFVKWGCEDIEFGYRLNQKGKIVYCRDAVVFHYSHNRDPFGYAASNSENLCYFLRKHQCFELEVFCSFKQDINPARMDSLTRMCQTLAEQNDGICPPINEGEAALLFPTKAHPNGRIEYIEDGQRKHFDLFGFAIPVENRRFKRIYLTRVNQLLPDVLLAMVYQESLRAAGEVLVSHEPVSGTAVYFDEPGFFNGTPVFKESIYVCQFIENFVVSPYNEHYSSVVRHKECMVSLTGRE